MCFVWSVYIEEAKAVGSIRSTENIVLEYNLIQSPFVKTVSVEWPESIYSFRKITLFCPIYRRRRSIDNFLESLEDRKRPLIIVQSCRSVSHGVDVGLDESKRLRCHIHESSISLILYQKPERFSKSSKMAVKIWNHAPFVEHPCELEPTKPDLMI